MSVSLPEKVRKHLTLKSHLKRSNRSNKPTCTYEVDLTTDNRHQNYLTGSIMTLSQDQLFHRFLLFFDMWVLPALLNCDAGDFLCLNQSFFLPFYPSLTWSSSLAFVIKAVFVFLVFFELFTNLVCVFVPRIFLKPVWLNWFLLFNL